MNLYHVDCYRLNGVTDFLNMGGETLLLPEDGVCLFEWASIIKDVLPEDVIKIDFTRYKDEPEKRKLNIFGFKDE